LREELLEDDRLVVEAVGALAVDFFVPLEYVVDECAAVLCEAVTLFVTGFASGFLVAVEAVAESLVELCWPTTAAGTKTHVRINAQEARCRTSRIRGQERIIPPKEKAQPTDAVIILD
jgi:hypothetical protein